MLCPYIVVSRTAQKVVEDWKASGEESLPDLVPTSTEGKGDAVGGTKSNCFLSETLSHSHTN